MAKIISVRFNIQQGTYCELFQWLSQGRSLAQGFSPPRGELIPS